MLPNFILKVLSELQTGQQRHPAEEEDRLEHQDPNMAERQQLLSAERPDGASSFSCQGNDSEAHPFNSPDSIGLSDFHSYTFYSRLSNSL